MNKKSPNVIFKSQYCLALNNIDNKNKSENYKKDRLNDVDEMFDYFSNEKKKLVGMFEYYMGHTRKENINLILQNGSYATKEDLKKLKQDYKEYIKNSNLWKGILSFKAEYLNSNIDIKTLEKRIAKDVMPQFLKYCGFKDMKNMSYVFSIHTNTKKHPHIHLAFIEKKPNYQYCDNKINYRRKGKITIDEQRYFKRLVELAIEKEKYYTPMLKKTNEDIDYLKTYFNHNEKNFILNNIKEIYLEENILKLGELLKLYRENNNQTSKRIKYNSIKSSELGNQIKSLTNEIKKYLFHNENSILHSCKKEIDSDLEKINNYFSKLNENNNILENVNKNSIVIKKGEYIDNYIYNSIINHALYKYEHISMAVKNKSSKDKITIEDLIQEIVYQNANNEILSDKDRRKRILNNYFFGKNINSKFPNKYKIESAIKKINYEMEQSAEMFSELFDYNDKKI